MFKVKELTIKETRKKTTCGLKSQGRIETEKIIKLLRGLGYNV